MALVARAFTPATGVAPNSDLESVEFRDGALVVVVACSIDPDCTVHGLRVTFTDVAGFRVLGEVDLVRYWASEGFAHGSHVLEVERGAWAEEDDASQGIDWRRREWLVVTGNWSASVFSATPPHIVDAAWKFVE